MAKLINIGFDHDQKLNLIGEYLRENPNINYVVYFTHKNNTKSIDLVYGNLEVENRTWDDVIMYKYFYPLLEKIDHNTLIIFDEMLRTRKRNDLTYNCCHHYGNQTEHIMVFEWFPMIEYPEDFMILLDLAYPNVYKGTPYSPEYLRLDSVKIKPRMLEIDKYDLYAEIPQDIQDAYDEEKEMLFDGIGNKDPDTIPRTLHLWCGSHCKKKMLESNTNPYIVRNDRYKTKNTVKWTDSTVKREQAVNIADFPVRQLQFNDFMKYRTVNTKLRFMNSGLSADEYYCKTYTEWLERLGGMYVEAGLQERQECC